MRSLLTVPRFWLFLLSGILWSIAGTILLWRAQGWIADVATEDEIMIGSVGLILGLIFFFTLFRKIARRYRTRIASLPEHVPIYKFISLKSALMILMMVTLGIMLRLSPFPKHYLAVLYTAMGEALWLGSFLFYNSWITTITTKERAQ